MQGIDSDLAGLHLKEADGEDIRLGSVWDDQTVVLIWLRHYR